MTSYNNATNTPIDWQGLSQKELVGKTIAEVRYMTDKEADGMDWDSKPLVIFFTDNSYIFASRDDEGNNGGALAVGPDETLPVLRGDD